MIHFHLCRSVRMIRLVKAGLNVCFQTTLAYWLGQWSLLFAAFVKFRWTDCFVFAAAVAFCLVSGFCVICVRFSRARFLVCVLFRFFSFYLRTSFEIFEFHFIFNLSFHVFVMSLCETHMMFLIFSIIIYNIFNFDIIS